MFDPLGPGWHIDRPAFDAGLLGAVRQNRRARRQQACDPRAAAAFVIDATGRSARIARAFGARRERADRLVAVFREAAVEGSSTTVVAHENR